ncbi:hypothetical protein PF010_g25461 [Phytophthora fragariae]|uniref:Uncharacterized protein n=1 Tax=Phytophthora fragariae TaxID=53985 RepID=A0A6A3WQQ8_9STRA|nr:hypothetical protein PF011_g23777 [Phytophthora fragariae]KAE9072494.1 hypothetical protein PF010_g25461 [Phytophthora fragariae]KAE9095576.1 hypothetical protein PF007_g17322 [Phytophthora fragariae]KAE9105396.1 hypothetical protein PF006_g21650 [Phytophthora fragariae]KAE9186200.1 hypothetical protein PF002_g25949 [Phytophthora fragariae]
MTARESVIRQHGRAGRAAENPLQDAQRGCPLRPVREQDARGDRVHCEQRDQLIAADVARHGRGRPQVRTCFQ